jgi:hypothetical protein
VNSIDLMLVYRYIATNDPRGDINGDRVTDVRDAQVVASQLGRRCSFQAAPTTTPTPPAPPTNTPVPTPTPFRCPDVNGDGGINAIDLALIYRAFGTTNAAADVNGDGTVNVLDAQLVASQLSRKC